MSKGPIQRLHVFNKDLDGSLEVRNWLDSVEDKTNEILGPVWSELAPKIGEIVCHESMFGEGTAEDLKAEMMLTVERLVKEYGND